MTNSTERLSVGALISVILRRKINRTIDVKWLVENEVYAHEIIKLCREQGMDDLNEYADHLEQLMFGDSKAAVVEKAAVPKPETVKKELPDWINALEEEEAAEEDVEVDPNKYIGGLR